MPGRIRKEEDEAKPSSLYKTESESTRYRGSFGMPEHTTPQIMNGEAYTVPYPFRTMTTGYGLCEPQWSQGPPPLNYQLSPYSPTPLPPLFRINPILEAHSNLLNWMLHQPPQVAISRTASPNVAGQWHLMPATDPSMMVPITIKLHPVRAPIVVTASHGVITVGDVLGAVYNAVRREATERLRTSFGSTSRLARNASGARLVESSRTCGFSNLAQLQVEFLRNLAHSPLCTQWSTIPHVLTGPV